MWALGEQHDAYGNLEVALFATCEENPVPSSNSQSMLYIGEQSAHESTVFRRSLKAEERCRKHFHQTLYVRSR